EYIADNRIHALSIKAYTPAQWERDRKLSGL
ncbi:cell division protein BolA, partial [Vibrio parahaemolyticus]